MRVYIPGTLADLAGSLEPAWRPASAYAVTDALRDAIDGDDEELYDEAARDAAALDSVMELGSHRRVVVVAEMPASEVKPTGGHPAGVTLVGDARPEDIVCAFVDEADAEADGAAAAAGDAAALERLEERNLLWYDASELAYLE